MKVTPKTELGRLAEQKACDFLLKKGLRLIARNFHWARGEIDLIMQDGEDVVFIEVRSRASIAYGSAAESVDKNKQKKLLKSALFYLQKRNWLEKVSCRFDIVGISHARCEWIKNAFSMDAF